MSEHANPILHRIEELAAEGYHPSGIHVESTDRENWTLTISLCDFVPLGEGGDLPHHVIKFNRREVPQGVTVDRVSCERVPNDTITVRGRMYDIDAWISEVATVGGAPDYASSCDGKRVWFLTKPARWMPRR